MTDPTSLPNFPPPPEDRPLRGRVLDALQDLKLDPDLTERGDVKFTAQNQRLFVRSLKAGQVDIMRTFGHWKISDKIPDDPTTRLNASNDVTLGVSLVKAGISGGTLVLSVEQVIGPKENPSAKVQIATGLLLQAVGLWHKNALAKSARYQAISRGASPAEVQAAAQAAAGVKPDDAAAAGQDGDVNPAPGKAKEVGPWLSEPRPNQTDDDVPEGGLA